LAGASFSDRFAPTFAASLAFLSATAAIWILDHVETLRYQQEVRSKTVQQLSTVRGKIESALNQRLYLTVGLKAQVEVNPDITEEEFAELAASLMKTTDGVRSMTLIKDNVISDVYPREGNESAIGLRLLDQPAQAAAVRRAIDSRESWLAGPVKLFQGGEAFIHRVPVYTAESGGRDYWGLVSILIDKETIVAEIAKVVPQELEIAIRGIDGLGVGGDYFVGNSLIESKQPLDMGVSLPSGTWRIFAAPKQGWPKRAPISAGLRLSGGLFALLSAAMVFFVVHTNVRYRIAQQEALAGTRAKSTFLANMSHEIRTPLNAVIGLTEATLNTELTAVQRDHLRTVKNSGESLLVVINDILDFSKIESGKLRLEQVSFNLHETLGDALRTMALQAKEKGLQLVACVAPDVPADLIGDPTRLRQVITNLVSNAIKFTQEGEVVVRAAVAPHEGKLLLEFSVADTGIGVNPEQLERLFAPFEQADTTTTRRFGGTGLGLSICRQLVGMMGGQINAKSEPGRGTTFTFTSVFGRARNDSTGDKVAVAPPGIRTLVLSPPGVARECLLSTLESWKMPAETLTSLSEAESLLASPNDSGDAWRLLIVDLSSHAVSLKDLSALLRQPGFATLSLVLLVPVGWSHELSEISLKHTITTVPSPLVQPELRQAIHNAITGQSSATTAPAVESQEVDSPSAIFTIRQAERSQPLKILVVDDSLANQKVALSVLNKSPCEVHTADNGRLALEQIAQNEYDVILMDVQMPEMDGFEATAAIRGSESPKQHTPIIAMTAHAQPDDRAACIAAGMDDYVSKPVRRHELFAAVLRVLGEESAEAAPIQEKPNVQSSFRLNRERLLDMVGGSKSDLKMVISATIQELKTAIGGLPGLLSGDNLKELRRFAHTVRGAMRMVAAEHGESIARDLELLAAGDNFQSSRAATLFEHLAEGTELVLAELTQFQDDLPALPEPTGVGEPKDPSDG